MKLRYIIESNFAPTFTVTKNTKDINEAYNIIERLNKINKKKNRIIYQGYKIYNDNNELLITI